MSIELPPIINEKVDFIQLRNSGGLWPEFPGDFAFKHFLISTLVHLGITFIILKILSFPIYLFYLYSAYRIVQNGYHFFHRSKFKSRDYLPAEPSDPIRLQMNNDLINFGVKIFCRTDANGKINALPVYEHRRILIKPIAMQNLNTLAQSWLATYSFVASSTRTNHYTSKFFVTATIGYGLLLASGNITSGRTALLAILVAFLWIGYSQIILELDSIWDRTRFWFNTELETEEGRIATKEALDYAYFSNRSSSRIRWTKIWKWTVVRMLRQKANLPRKPLTHTESVK